jgi:hypothetical protein
MSGWTIARDGNVKLEHLSTSSLIKLSIGEVGVYLEYSEFDALKRAMKEIEKILP